MPVRTVHLHNGRCLWPQYKALEEVLDLKATTPTLVWSGTYQGLPVPSGGYIFKREWWREKGRRFDITSQAVKNTVFARYLSIDTANKAKETNDPSAFMVGEIMPDYRLNIRYATAERLEFPALAGQPGQPGMIERLATEYNRDGKLRGILIEDKQSGTSALQTLAAVAPPWIASLLLAFMPGGDKPTRAGQAAVWCNNGSVCLPYVSPDLYWLVDFEEELFNFPQATHDDRVDTLSQLIIYLENYLMAGYHARNGA